MVDNNIHTTMSVFNEVGNSLTNNQQLPSYSSHSSADKRKYINYSFNNVELTPSPLRTSKIPMAKVREIFNKVISSPEFKNLSSTQMQDFTLSYHKMANALEQHIANTWHGGFFSFGDKKELAKAKEMVQQGLSLSKSKLLEENRLEEANPAQKILNRLVRNPYLPSIGPYTSLESSTQTPYGTTTSLAPKTTSSEGERLSELGHSLTNQIKQYAKEIQDLQLPNASDKQNKLDRILNEMKAFLKNNEKDSPFFPMLSQDVIHLSNLVTNMKKP